MFTSLQVSFFYILSKWRVSPFPFFWIRTNTAHKTFLSLLSGLKLSPKVSMEASRIVFAESPARPFAIPQRASSLTIRSPARTKHTPRILRPPPLLSLSGPSSLRLRHLTMPTTVRSCLSTQTSFRPPRPPPPRPSRLRMPTASPKRRLLAQPSFHL